MLVLLVLEGTLIALLAVLVVGLLRSHAEILRRLHDLGVDAYDDGEATGARRPIELRTSPGVPEPRPTSTPAADLSGTTPSGSAAVVGVLGRPHTTLLAFLSSGCLTCESFWRSLGSGAAGRLPGRDTRLVIVTKGPESESLSAVQALASEGVTTLMSTVAWSDYEVPVSPYFILVDGPSSRVIGEGAAASWDQVASLLEQACADAGLTTSGEPLLARAHRLNGAQRERRADEALLAAGITPDHPSLRDEASLDDTSDIG